MPSSLFSLLVLYCLPAFANQVVRHDFMVQNGSSIELLVREIVSSDAARNRSAPALLLIHGARVPGIASFDLPAPGGSLAADLAAQGFAVYVMDIRGYGSSTRPPEMSQSPAAHSSLVRSNDAVDDIAAVVDWIASRRHVSRVALFGWATGGQWAAHFASLHPDRVNALVLLNSLTGGSDQHSALGHGSDSEDPTHPGRFNPASCGAYHFNDAASLLRAWERSIPVADKSEWRDPAVSNAYVAAALASDPTSTSRTPPSFRSPCGALEDSFYLAVGAQLWDSSRITAPTLIFRSEPDFWSRPEDASKFAAQLTHSPKASVVLLPAATPFVHLDRPARGRSLLLANLVSFLIESVGKPDAAQVTPLHKSFTLPAGAFR
jgi:pimeloyl-ACP methyl ester carboxylesterase